MGEEGETKTHIIYCVNTCLFKKWSGAPLIHFTLLATFLGLIHRGAQDSWCPAAFFFFFLFCLCQNVSEGAKNQTNLVYNNNNNNNNNSNKKEKLLGWGNTQKYVTNHVIGFWLTLLPIRTIHFFELLLGGKYSMRRARHRPIICGACKHSENQTDTKFDLAWQIKISFNSGNTQRDLGRS